MISTIGHDAITIDYALTTTKIIVAKISTCLKFKFTAEICMVHRDWARMTTNNYEWPRMTMKNGIVANCDLNRYNVNGALGT